MSSSFSCDDGAGGSWLISCVDQSGRRSGSPLDTSTLGSHTFTVTATTRDGLTGKSSVTYQVLPSGGGSTGPGGGTGGGGGSGGGVNPVTVIVGALHVNHHRFYLGKLPPHFTRAIPTGTTISLSVNLAARVTFAFTQLLPGKRSGRRCAAPKPRRRHARACTRRIKAGSLSFNAAAGTHKLFFDGRLSNRKTLRPGKYELAVTATASGSTSRVQKLTLTLLAPPRHH